MSGHNGGAHNGVRAFPDMNSRKTSLLTVQNRPVDLAQFERVRFDLHASGCGILLIDADMGNFRLRVGAPGDEQCVCACIPESKWVWEQRILHDDLCHGVGRMGKLEPGADITCGENVPIACLQPAVYLHALCIVFHTGLLEAKSFHVRSPTDTEKDLVDDDLVRPAM